jgi:hypothetical protein
MDHNYERQKKRALMTISKIKISSNNKPEPS